MRKRCWNSRQTSARRPLPQTRRSACRDSSACAGLGEDITTQLADVLEQRAALGDYSFQKPLAEKRSGSTTAPPPTSVAPVAMTPPTL